ncbi:MAG: hypothetical protein ACREBR_00260 [bacterium]
MPSGGDSCLPNHHSKNAGAHYHLGCIEMPTQLGFYVRLPPSRAKRKSHRSSKISAFGTISVYVSMNWNFPHSDLTEFEVKFWQPSMISSD